MLSLLALLVLSSVFASPKFTLGASFSYDVTLLAPALLDKFENIGDVYDNGNFSSLHAVGPKIEAVFFPSSAFPLGLGISSTTMFTVGYDGTDYLSYKQDFRQDFGIGLYYQQPGSGSWGVFADLAFTYSFYRVATDNSANSKEPVDYIYFTNYGLTADLGVYVESHSSYFKIGPVVYYDLEHYSDFSFRYGMIMAFGLCL